MAGRYESYIPESLGDLLDKMSVMLIRSPTFIDQTGYFPDRNIQTEFYALNEGLKRLRPELGEPLFLELMKKSDQMRACFEADPEDKTGETRRGKRLALEMEDLLISKARSGRVKSRTDPGVPETIGDLLQEFDYALRNSPTCIDKTGYFPDLNLDGEFLTLDNGIRKFRPELGETFCEQLLGLSAMARASFEADPEDATGEADKGRGLIVAMMELIKHQAWDA